ncbi:MAG: hypothetical protein Q8Q38_01130 [bacterium]|nr:hypothetical protein [bacterium]MDZ4232031.1 hypothetical protein [Candidatus Pacearchaeota archaeon]
MKNIALIARRSGRIQLITLVVLGLVFLAGGYAFLVPSVSRAAALTSVKDTLSTSAPDTLANHTIQFVTAAGVDASTDTITLTFDASPSFQMGAFALLNFDLAVDTDGTPGNCTGTLTDKTLATGAGVGIWGVGQAGQVVTFTAPTNAASGEIAVNSCVIIEIGDNATVGGAGAKQIKNPVKVDGDPGTADVETINIGGTFGDTGTAMTATIAGVTVSVTISESLSLTLAVETAANCPDTPNGLPGTDKSDDENHTATAITFGALAAGNAFNYSCHLASVSTNAVSGYTTIIEKSQLLTSVSSTIADGVCNGGCSNTVSAVWSTTSSNGFGYCLQDAAGNSALTTDASDDAGTGAVDWVAAAQCNDATPQFKTIPTTASTEPIMKSYTPVSGDQIRMGAMLNYAGSQAAGTYTTTLTFITTPTF